MWLEVKAIFTFISMMMMAIGMYLAFYFDFLIVFFLIMSLFFFILGDIVIGWKITSNHLIPLLDPLPPNSELCVYFDFSGNMDFLVVQKDKEGTRRFVKYKKNATIINKGDYQIRAISGNHGFVGHEDYIFNTNLNKAKALEKEKGDTIKEIYANKKHIKKEVVGVSSD